MLQTSPARRRRKRHLHTWRRPSPPGTRRPRPRPLPHGRPLDPRRRLSRGYGQPRNARGRGVVGRRVGPVRPGEEMGIGACGRGGRGGRGRQDGREGESPRRCRGGRRRRIGPEGLGGADCREGPGLFVVAACDGRGPAGLAAAKRWGRGALVHGPARLDAASVASATDLHKDAGGCYQTGDEDADDDAGDGGDG